MLIEHRAGYIRIGTSGWSFPDWRGPFYPSTMGSGRWLAYYARDFHTVEINSSFYQLPKKWTVDEWREAVPDGFTFALKASRFLTYVKRLKEPEEPIATLIQRMDALEDRLGPILFQLPPNWHFNEQRLTEFLLSLPEPYQYVLEVRDRSWLNPTTYELLTEHGVALCIHDLGGFRFPHQETADFVYVRLNGPAGSYGGSYSDQQLQVWAKRLVDWSAQGLDAYLYFNNDRFGYAVKDAQRLVGLVEGAVEVDGSPAGEAERER